MPDTELTIEPGKHNLVITRVFDAPRDLVFKTVTDSSLIPQWWGQSNLTTTVEKMEVKTGGVWRYVQRDPAGNEFAFNGVYHAVVPPELLIYTFEFEGMPNHVMLETVTFEEQDGKTRMIDTPVFQTVEDRDAALASGMEQEASESTDRFAEVLAKSEQ